MFHQLSFGLICIILLNCAFAISFPEPAPHPRLFLLDSDLPLVRDAIANDNVSAFWYNSLLQTANGLLKDNTTVVWTTGRILTQSREVLARVGVLAGIYRLTGNESYAARAMVEMKAAAGFPYWDQQAFLDTAEMTNALAIGYDWLYDWLSDNDKEIIETAIYEKGFHFGMETYNGNWTKDPLMEGNFNWNTCNFNWNFVCNGGLTVGAIALWEVFPEVTQEILQYALKGIPDAIVSYGPDGGWIEGPVYWNYATRYLSYTVAGSLTAFGTDFGLFTNYSYVSLTGYFRIHALSPNFLWDNYGDCEVNTEEYSWAMIFMGRYFNNSLYIAHERKVATSPSVDATLLPLNILHLFYSRAEDAKLNFPFVPPAPPMEAYFRHVDVVTFRTEWQLQSTTYWYGAIKGGDTTQTHQDLDLGHFVIEKNGHRMALDLGADNYSLPDYFTIPQRYQYYRTNTSGHNALVFNGEWNNQQITQAPVTNYTSTPSLVYASVDLTAAYHPNATSVIRAFSFDRTSEVVTISDTIVPNKNTSSVTWRFHTQAYVSVSGNKALLTMASAQTQAIIVSPSGISWDTYYYNFSRPYYSAANLQVLQFTIPVKTTTEIVVQFI